MTFGPGVSFGRKDGSVDWQPLSISPLKPDGHIYELDEAVEKRVSILYGHFALGCQQGLNEWYLPRPLGSIDLIEILSMSVDNSDFPYERQCAFTSMFADSLSTGQFVSDAEISHCPDAECSYHASRSGSIGVSYRSFLRTRNWFRSRTAVIPIPLSDTLTRSIIQQLTSDNRIKVLGSE